METQTELDDQSDLMEQLRKEKKAANELQVRRHDDWTDNYDLYRNRVKTNRLTQRQAVNIPLMKETVKTILSKIDEAPLIDWQELSGDEAKEIVYQEVWDSKYQDGKFELVDLLDKKNVLIYGIGTKKFRIESDGVCIDALDPYDVVFDPLMATGDVETARFVVHQNIFRSIRDILADDRYTDAGKDSLKMWADAPAGVTQSGENKERLEKKLQRLKDMGLTSSNFPIFAGGDRIVNLTEHFTTLWDVGTQKWERRVIVYAEDSIPLMDMSLKEATGVDFWPFTVWNEDPESQDIYADSVADLVRTPNKVVNAWFSQLIENRTLKNFQMHWFLPGKNYTPQTYTPGPGVMLPAPPGEDINKVIKPVEVSGLDDTLAAISAITGIVERGSGATAIEKGQPESGTQTLGEVQILVGKAMERTVGIAKFYRMAWFETAWKWDKLMHANAPKFLRLYKTSQSGKIYPKRVYAGDWVSDVGYRPIVRSSSEQEQETLKTVQKYNFVMQQFPNNTALRKIAQKRTLELIDLTPEEIKQVGEEEEKIVNEQTAPGQEQLQSQVQSQLQELSAINAAQ